MSSLSLHVKYRPIRIGWCVRQDNIEDYRRALKLTHTLWGGKYNPLIPVNEESYARQLVNLFQVDALYPAAEDEQVKNFIKKFPYLPWPEMHKKLFIEGMKGKMANFLDIFHPVRFLYDEYVKNQPDPKISYRFFNWEEDDPIANILLATVGELPTVDEIGIDYKTIIEKFLPNGEYYTDKKQPIPAEIWGNLTFNEITSYRLYLPRSDSWNNPGFYIGDANNFDDLLYYWNLRAAGIELLFYDFKYTKRLKFIRDQYLEELSKRPPSIRERENYIAIWTNSEEKIDLSEFGTQSVLCRANYGIFNGLNVKPSLAYLDEHSVLGSIDEEYESPRVTFQLPEKPFFDDYRFYAQHLIATVNPTVDVSHFKDYTFRPPFIPELNEYYGRNFHFIWNEVRAEKKGVGVVINVTKDQLSLTALNHRNIIEKAFEVFGIKSESSQPGLICTQLIHQMGGLQGCRVFKIKGVRELIEKYNPYQSFDRSEAIRIIGQLNESTGKPQFEEFENLVLEYRKSTKKWNPKNAFIYLVKNDVFRVGLKFDCPNCKLVFWTPLDNVRTIVECEYCGHEFNITSQLKDRCWAYRRSGLFGREDHQEGGIPVALTLQQLDTTLNWNPLIYSTAMKLSPISTLINPCETDLIVINQTHDGRVQIVIGECKTNKPIEQNDVENLSKVADALPSDRFEIFILFSKLCPFTKKEIEICRLAQDKYRYRVILLTDRELEPYFIYERTAKEYNIDGTAISLEDLAKVTYDIYFNPNFKINYQNR